MRHDRFIKTVLPLKDKLFRLAFRLTGNREDAEDVVQDTMLRVWNRGEEVDVIDNLEAYCVRSVRNIALDKIALKSNQYTELPEEIEFSDNQSIEDDVVHQETVNLLFGFIDKLPEKQKSVVQLRDVEGLSYKEIAEAMAMTEEQVKVTLFRARQRLKAYFERIK